MSTRNQGIMYFQNGVGRLRGYLISANKDGDKMITELAEENSSLNVTILKGYLHARHKKLSFPG